MSRLTIINDSIRGERETVDLYCGESLASNLRRLYPGGIRGPWRIYRDAVHADNEIAALALPSTVVAPLESYVLTRGTAADPVSFFINLAISTALSYVASLLVSRPRPPQQRAAETQESGNNQLAAQSNQVRLGGRVPEVLGKVRSFPDLLCYPIEDYWQKTQNIMEYFVVGMGDHDIPLDEVRLGESPVIQIGNATPHVFHPGDYLPDMPCLRESPEVQGISLNPESDASAPIIGAVFSAAAKTMTTDPDYAFGLDAEKPCTIGSTSFNNGFRWIMTVPDITAGPPYVYQLDGPIANETASGPTFAVWDQVSSSFEEGIYFGTSSPYSPTPTNQDIRVNGNPWAIGDVLLITDYDEATPVGVYRGTVTYVNNVFNSFGFPQQIIRLTDVNGVVHTVPAWSTLLGYISAYHFPVGRTALEAAPRVIEAEPTGWYTAPIEDPDEIWIDVGFPMGLTRTTGLGTDHLGIVVVAEFKRADASDPQALITFPEYNGATNVNLRFTHKVTRAALAAAGLPGTGSGWIQVRLTRTTPYYVNTSEVTFTQDTRWQRLQAMRLLLSRTYPDVTIIGLSMSNTRNAVQMGQTNLNCIATRKLPTWTGTAWTAAAPTEKWADNFVARCRAADGARKSDAQIDLTGIYALQTYLDTLDPIGDGTGAQGKISLTLDQTQDIDSELTQIADVVRAIVYRVGKKIYVTRDQANATSIALFNARAKSPDAESVAVRMTNDGENDAVTVAWLDVASGYKVREYTHTTTSAPRNPLRVSAFCANWQQAWRRAAYEWNRIRYRREQISVNVTEDGRICRPGDVVNITDDIANLATSAGEILYYDPAISIVMLDRDVEFIAGHTYTLMVRDIEGQAVDLIPVTAVAGIPNRVHLSRAPIPEVTVKGRDSATGTLYAFYDDAAANVRRWLLTNVSLSGPYVQLQGTNYNALVYQDDAATVPDPPPLLTEPAEILRGLPE